MTLSKLREASYSGALKGDFGSPLILRQESDLGKLFSLFGIGFFFFKIGEENVEKAKVKSLLRLVGD